MTDDSTGPEALDALFWRSEILQALYWMRGEGLASAVTPTDLARFLVMEAAVIAREMARLAEGGYLERAGSSGEPEEPEKAVPAGYAGKDGAEEVRYCLTESGLAEGERSFHDEFADYLHRGHGECSDDCWCKDPAHAGKPCPTHEKAHHAT
ncbi:MAG: MarR family transcriptional regulator [Armatimonadetes bacterium]|nr:MarR family transcriptional regulator [Armatimonadota bacterium]